MILLLLAAACGKVGDPLPPFIRVPEAVTDLSVRQSGEEFVLSWTNPARFIDGSSATDLSKVRILINGQTLTTVNVTAAGQAQSFSTPTATAAADLAKFSVQVETTDQRVSLRSNEVPVQRVEVPGPVNLLRAEFDLHRIRLEWEPPRDRPELATAYVIRRADRTEAITVTESWWEDRSYEPGQTYRYSVIPVRRVGEQMVPGTAGSDVEVTTVDRTPPRAPQGLEGVAADPGGFLTWTAGDESDLSGYRVFRSESPDSGFVPVVQELHTTNALFDVGYRTGIYYVVSAVDESGNESARSAPFRVP